MTKTLKKLESKRIKTWAMTHENTLLLNDGIRQTIFRTRKSAKENSNIWNVIIPCTITYTIPKK